MKITTYSPPLLRYICVNCGNKCLVGTKPDNTICGGCDKPDWKLLKHQESYIVGGVDWEHSDGEV